jgi:hypothetical protein
MSDHDNTNSGVIFEPHQDQVFAGQGRVNIEGADKKIIMIYEKLSRSGDPVLVLYERTGVLFSNDKKGNDKAPDLTGPLDLAPNHRIAGWKGMKDGRKFMSLKVSEKGSGNGNSNGSANGDDGGQGGYDPSARDIDDEIPF